MDLAFSSRLLGAALVGIWLAGTAAALLGARRRAALASAALAAQRPAPASPPDIHNAALSPEVFNLSSLPIWWVSRDLRLAGANEAYARAVGHRSPQGAVRANAELGPGIRGLGAEARASDRAVVGEERVTIDGERRLLEIIAVPLRGGEVAFLALDETRRHAAHSAAAARARGLAETLDELATAVAWFDPDTTLLHSNAAFATLFALDRAWLDSRPDFERVLDAMRTAARLPETADFTAWRAESRAWFSATEPITQDWILPGGTLLHVVARSRDGGLLLVIDDETERTRLAAAREQLLAVHTATLEHLREGVAVFGPDGRLKFANGRLAEIFVASPEMLAPDLPAERLIEHIAGLLGEPGQAQGLRELIMSATAGRTARGGRTTSALGYVVDFAGVPLPDGNALLTVNVVEEGAKAPPLASA